MGRAGGGRESGRGGDYPGLVAIRAGPVVAAIDNGVLFAFAPVGAPGRGWTFRPPTGGLEDWITADATTIYAGSSDGRLYAVDAESGTPRWVTVVSAESEAQARAPRVRDGVVYVGIKRVVAPSEGGVAAVDAATGAVRWVRAFSSGRGAACSGDVAFLADGTVIAAAADGQIYALDPATGAPRWVAPSLTGIPAIWGGDPSLDRRPLLARGDLVVAGSTTGYLVGLDASSGRERWRSRADQGSAVSPLVADDALTYAMHFGGQLVAFDLLSGAVRWIDGREPGGGAYADAPILDGGTLYVSGHHGLYALRAGQ
jgi:outer membrane protein assembly factor BamB